MGVMINCKEASSLIEKEHEQEIGLGNKLKLAFHLLVCKVCAIYAKQSKLIERVLKGKAGAPPSAEDVTRLKQQVREKMNL